jgi:hypothetical protein
MSRTRISGLVGMVFGGIAFAADLTLAGQPIDLIQ